MDNRITPIGSPLFTKTVLSSQSWLYRHPDYDSPKETQALKGHRFCVYKDHHAWSYGQLISPLKGSSVSGYVGWMDKAALGGVTTVSHRVTALAAPIFNNADIKSAVAEILPLGALIAIAPHDDKFAKCELGYIPKIYIAEDEEGFEQDFVKVAEAHIGRPYIWAGISSEGLDCSGLVLSSLRATGRDAPRDADMQEADLGETVSQANKRGDLVFWPGHVGIMLDDITLLHANAYHMRVASEPLAEAEMRIGAIRTVKRLS